MIQCHSHTFIKIKCLMRFWDTQLAAKFYLFIWTLMNETKSFTFYFSPRKLIAVFMPFLQTKSVLLKANSVKKR